VAIVTPSLLTTLATVPIANLYILEKRKAFATAGNFSDLQTVGCILVTVAY